MKFNKQGAEQFTQTIEAILGGAVATLTPHINIASAEAATRDMEDYCENLNKAMTQFGLHVDYSRMMKRVYDVQNEMKK